MLDAKVILDSVNEYGDRLTTVEATIARFTLSEFNTHRAFSRNSASSRAIPIPKQLLRLRDTPCFPIAWTSEQKGMQGGPELAGEDLDDAKGLFRRVYQYTLSEVERYVEEHPLDQGGVRLHKSRIARLMEPFLFHTVIASSTQDGWDNFFRLRSSYFTKLAEPEIMAVADLIYDAMKVSEPTLLQHGEWHTPYIRSDDEFCEILEFGKQLDPMEARKRVSTARCARVSYLTHDGVRSIIEDLEMFDRLNGAEPPHDSPFEHVATPALRAEETRGNFRGWHQARHHPDFRRLR